MIIENITDFDTEQTLDCGQAFRWTKQENGTFKGIAGRKAVSIGINGDKVIIDGADEKDKDYWIHYLDLDLAKPAKKQGASLDGYLGVDYETFADITAADAKNYFNVAWSQYDSLELETEIGEVSFKLDSVTVSFESYYTPTVTIKFVDQRGSALFASLL